MTKTRRKIDAVLKAKIALEALREQADSERSCAALPSSSKPDLRLEEAAAGPCSAGV